MQGSWALGTEPFLWPGNLTLFGAGIGVGALHAEFNAVALSVSHHKFVGVHRLLILHLLGLPQTHLRCLICTQVKT